MYIDDLVLSFLDKRSDQEEKRRQIEYDRRNEMIKLQKLLPSPSKQFLILNLNDVIQYDKKIYEQLTAELNDIKSELKPILIERSATYHKPVEVFIENQTYGLVWLDDDCLVQGIRRISKL